MKTGRLKLVLAAPEHKEQVWAYRQEFLDGDEDMAGTAGLKNAESYEDWLEGVTRNLPEGTVGLGRVPATTFLAMTEEGELLRKLAADPTLSGPFGGCGQSGLCQNAGGGHQDFYRREIDFIRQNGGDWA